MNTLRKFRMAYGYEQKKLAAKLHCSPGYVSDLEHGLKKPSHRFAVIIANVFGVRPEIVFPDGFADPKRGGKRPCVPNGGGYVPSPEIPRPLVLRCWKCGAVRVSDNLTCYQCGAWFDEWRNDGQVRCGD